MRNGLPFSIHLSRHHPTWSGKEMPQERTGPRQPPWLWPCYQSSRQAGSTLLHPNSPTPLRGRGVCACVREKEKNKERAGPKQVKGGGHQAHSWPASTSSSCKFPLGGAGTCSNCKKKKKAWEPRLGGPRMKADHLSSSYDPGCSPPSSFAPRFSTLAAYWNHARSFKNSWYVAPTSRAFDVTGLVYHLDRFVFLKSPVDPNGPSELWITP